MLFQRRILECGSWLSRGAVGFRRGRCLGVTGDREEWDGFLGYLTFTGRGGWVLVGNVSLNEGVHFVWYAFGFRDDVPDVVAKCCGRYNSS